jgi:hypothetical protein
MGEWLESCGIAVISGKKIRIPLEQTTTKAVSHCVGPVPEHLIFNHKGGREASRARMQAGDRLHDPIESVEYR